MRSAKYLNTKSIIKKKIIAFLYTSNKQFKKVLLKLILFIIATKKNQSSEDDYFLNVEDFYRENCNVREKSLRVLKKWRNILISSR